MSDPTVFNPGLICACLCGVTIKVKQINGDAKLVCPACKKNIRITVPDLENPEAVVEEITE